MDGCVFIPKKNTNVAEEIQTLYNLMAIILLLSLLFILSIFFFYVIDERRRFCFNHNSTTSLSRSQWRKVTV